jgi:uncharacterized RDD family membrane protein YckC
MGPQGLPPGIDASQLAEWPQRAIGWLIDAIAFVGLWIVFYVLSLVIGFFIGLLGDLCALAIGCFLAYQVGAFGSTPGMRIAGVKCVSIKTGQPLGVGMGFLRWIIHIVASILCLVPFIVDMLFPLWDSQKQTLADKIGGSIVITVPKQPFAIMPKTP